MIKESSLKNECGKILLEDQNWRWVPGLSPGIAAHNDGTIRPRLGTITYRYHPQYGLYAPVSDEQGGAGVMMPVHLLVACAWLPRPDLTWFEIANYMHNLVIHRNGDVVDNSVGNLAWNPAPGGDDMPPLFYDRLMREADFAVAPVEVSPATSPVWRGE